MVTHLHCSTLASLLLDPNTVLGPMNLQTNKTEAQPTSKSAFRQNKVNIPMLHLLQFAFTGLPDDDKKKIYQHLCTVLFNWAYMLPVNRRTRLKTESKHILCTVYSVCVCVCVHTQLSSKPWPACHLLLMPGTGHCWTSAHSWHKLQSKEQNTANTLADQDNKHNVWRKLMTSQAIIAAGLKIWWSKLATEPTI